jgi:hypothetical protein
MTRIFQLLENIVNKHERHQNKESLENCYLINQGNYTRR